MTALAHPARTRVKICGLTREQDVDAAVAAGADAVGFVLYRASPRHVTPDRAAALAARLPPYVTPVLLFVNHPATEIEAALAAVAGSAAQFHGDEPAALCVRAAAGRCWLKAARIPLAAEVPFDLLTFAAGYPGAQAILLDAHSEQFGGTGKVFDWSRIPHGAKLHLVLSGGLTPANVGDGIALLAPRCTTLAVDVSSGVEGPTKGLKDADKIHRFVAAVRAADAARAQDTAS